MNEQNLQPGKYKLSQEQAKKGGIASAAAKKQRKAVKQAILDALYAEAPSGMTVMEEMVSGMIGRVIESGDQNTFEKIMEYAGMSPEKKRKDADLKLRQEALELQKAQADRRTDSGQEAAIRARAAVMQKVREELEKYGDQ